MTRFIAWLLTEPLFWAGWGIVLGPILFLRGFRLLQRKQLILDTPRSTIRGAALGLVEMSGKAVGPYTLVSPLSETDCLYYRLTGKSEPGSELVSPKMRELCAPLFLDDGTGTLMIYPERCELDLQPSFSSENDDAAEEYCIRPGDKIFVRGTLRENPWATKSPVTERGEFSRIGPGY